MDGNKSMITYDLYLNNGRTLIRLSKKLVRKYLRDNRYNTKVWVMGILEHETKIKDVTSEFLKRR